MNVADLVLLRRRLGFELRKRVDEVIYLNCQCKRLSSRLLARTILLQEWDRLSNKLRSLMVRII